VYKNTICITGVTGLLGRNIFFEYLKQYRDTLNDIQFVLFGRDSQDMSLKERIRDIFLNDGKFYLDLSENELAKMLKFLDEDILYINMDLEKENIGISDIDIQILSTLKITVFYHPGAYTSFSDSDMTKDKVDTVNTIGTMKLLNILKNLTINRFCYFSSAFATGLLSQKVSPSDLKVERIFRNPYEHSKLQAELLVRKFEEEHGIPSYIFRTSILAGRLMEKNIGQIHKYDVFYGWTQFFIKAKQSLIRYDEDLYDTPVKMDIRIMGSKKSTLNIIPADYAAKASIEIMSRTNIYYSSFHLVNTNETEFIIPILEFLNIEGYTFVDSIPQILNKTEKLYYKSVGRLFNDYMQNEGEQYFDCSSLTKSLDGKVCCPIVDRDNLQLLLSYAKKNNFGLSIPKHINFEKQKGA
jgi:thioester reductase-like protein